MSEKKTGLRKGKNMDHNAEIAEKIMGWNVERTSRHYWKPGMPAGAMEPIPDFVFKGKDNQLLRDRMESLGFRLNIVENPVDWVKRIGKTFTARFAKGAAIFEATETAAELAVCIAALKAFGVIQDDTSR